LQSPVAFAIALATSFRSFCFFLAVSVSNLAIAIAGDVRKSIVGVVAFATACETCSIDLNKATNIAAVGDYVALAEAPQRIPKILAVAAVSILAIAAVAVDALRRY